MILEGLNLAPHHVVIDPSCGDGSFLRGVVAAVAHRFRGVDSRSLAKDWAGRLIGFDIDESAVVGARCRLQAALREYLGEEIPQAALHVHQADVLRYPRLTPLLHEIGLRS